MAASITIEEHTGTYAGHGLRHNGYYAGDFSTQREPNGPAGASWSNDSYAQPHASSAAVGR